MRVATSLSLSLIGCAGVTGFLEHGRLAFLIGGSVLAAAGVAIAGLSPVEVGLRLAQFIAARSLDMRALWLLMVDILRDGPAEFRRRRESLAAALRPAEDSGTSIGWGGGGAAMGPGNDADAPSTGPSLYRKAKA